MKTATRKDILSVFPDIQDHAVIEILEMKSSVDDLEAAFSILMSDDKDLIDVKRREGGQIHRLMNILNQAGVQVATDRDG
jgi:hypothetical protein